MKFSKFKLIVKNILFFIILNKLTEARVIPDDVVMCHFNDSNCMKTSAQYLLNTYSNSGVRQLNILPIDPLRVNFLKINKNPKSPVNVELKFKDLDIFGIQKANIIKMSGFDADIKDMIEIQASVPRLELRGHYSINGNVLILPIVGEGKSQIVLEDVLITAKLHPEPFTKNGHIYLKVVSGIVEITPKHAMYNFENLFKGDRILGESMNKFLNENWSDIFNELQPDLSVAFGEIVMHVMNEPFSKFTYESLFLK